MHVDCGRVSMIEGIQYHGFIGTSYRYQVTSWGFEPVHRVFHESRGVSEKFFCGGNEIQFNLNDFEFEGFGGFLCEYMFGVELPLSDMVRNDVINRLVMFGAYHSKHPSSIVFTDRIQGVRTYEDLFLEGHAVINYIFFIQGKLPREPEEAQRYLTRKLGKTLKRTKTVQQRDDLQLARSIYNTLNDPEATVLLIRLIHLPHERLHQTLHDSISMHMTLSPETEEKLLSLSQTLNIPRYQYERIKIDCIYKRKEYRHLLEEYKGILVRSMGRSLTEVEKARLSRLRTLSVRHQIPPVVFDLLDEMLLQGRELMSYERPEYIRETQAILESIFISQPDISSLITHDDLKRLLLAKKRAVQLRDTTFEEILLETGRLCDEYTYQQQDERPFECFSYIVTYFDRFDATLGLLTKFAYMDEATFNEDDLRRLIQNRQIFNEIEPNLFNILFLNDLLQDPYLPYYGRRKLETLKKGIPRILEAHLSVPELLQQLNRWKEEEKLHNHLIRKLRSRQKDYYWERITSDEKDRLQNSLLRELYLEGHTIKDTEFFENVFERVLFNLKKESIYIHYVLPEVILNRAYEAREDFIRNSGLDRFYIEEIEKEYCELHDITLDTLTAANPLST